MKKSSQMPPCVCGHAQGRHRLRIGINRGERGLQRDGRCESSPLCQCRRFVPDPVRALEQHMERHKHLLTDKARTRPAAGREPGEGVRDE